MAALAIIYQIITTLDKLTIYRKFKLTQMYANFYGNENYQNARNRFVYKMNDDKTTPENIASHRRKEGLSKMPASGSMVPFVWQDYYQMGDEHLIANIRIYLF